MNGKIKLHSILILMLIFAANIFGQKLIEIADGRSFFESVKPKESETEFIKKEVKSKELAIKNLAKSADFKCDEDDAKENPANENVTANLGVYAVLKGAFTKPKTLQKVYFYQVCWSDGGKYATALGGMIIAENEKTVSHFVYVNVSGFDNPRVLPDINQNGLSEIVLRFTSKIDGLMIGRSVGIFEAGFDRITNFGEAETYDMSADEITAYKISTKAGKNPSFYRETYTDNSENEKSNWQIKGKTGRFSLKKTDSRNGFTFIKL